MLKFKLFCPAKDLSLVIGADGVPFDLEKMLSTVQVFLKQVGDDVLHSESFMFEGAPFEKLSQRTDLTAEDWTCLFDKFVEINNSSIGTERAKLFAKTLSAIEFSNVPFLTAIENTDNIILGIHPRDTRDRYQFIDDSLEEIIAEVQASNLSNLAQDAFLHALNKSKFKKIVLEKYKRLEVIRNWDVVVSLDVEY